MEDLNIQNIGKDEMKNLYGGVEPCCSCTCYCDSEDAIHGEMVNVFEADETPSAHK